MSGKAQKGRIQPGALLLQAREHAGLSLEEIAEKTRILLPRLEALENNDYAAAGGSATFIVGYIRAYARVVDASAGPILKAFEADYSVSNEEPAPAEQVYVPMENSTRGGFPIKTIVIVLLAIAIVVVFAQMLTTKKSVTSTAKSSSLSSFDAEFNAEPGISSGLQKEELKKTDMQIQRDNLTAENQDLSIDAHKLGDIEIESRVAVQDAQQIKDVASTGIVSTDTDIASAKKIISKNNAVTKKRITQTLDSKLDSRQLEVAKVVGAIDDAQAQTELTAGLDSLVMKFSDQCWVRVHDNTGKRIVYRLAKAGDEVNVQGQAPFDMLLGNAEEVSVHVNGRLIDTEPGIGTRKLRKKIGP